MKKRFSEEQIVRILQEAEIAKTYREVIRRHNITEQTFYRWKRKYGGMSVAEVKRLKSLEAENAILDTSAKAHMSDIIMPYRTEVR